MIRARLTSINGQAASELSFESGRAQNFAEREQNLTWAREPQANNKIVAGRWWTEGEAGRPWVWVATDFQEELA